MKAIGGPLDPRDPNRLLRGEYTDPNLQPWAAEIVKKYADAELEGAEAHIPTPQEVCRPSGVPGVMTLPGPIQLQTPEQVTILYQRDHMVRTVYLHQRHSAQPAITPYGESIGQYEGDTLVVDTIGLRGDTPVDLFGTPHTNAMHVVERYRAIGGGQKLEVTITVEDPNTFKQGWTGVLAYGRTPNSRWAGQTLLEEEICAENNRTFHDGTYPIPVAEGPGF